MVNNDAGDDADKYENFAAMGRSKRKKRRIKKKSRSKDPKDIDNSKQ
jgi:hypothetical protein